MRRTRAELGGDVRALTDKVDPQRRVPQLVTTAKGENRHCSFADPRGGVAEGATSGAKGQRTLGCQRQWAP